ncbi:S-methyl-5-thioribose kinase [Clostridium formicaceticum]|uniref:Methylthioribose kinase n=1 Tax=Clostridium formicaceticum TaxID=1497 RepID=A0AAC9RIG1_9CLOT|nr:S-methyl-5-thioribose kinase [Clostridium formicaceticum]AOY75743.1 S-methyl-5-thioribose kinase [Clostridium formicaceticum]ARE86065.1 Methylthioribose kinase [Clostridium formicaceticum]
MAANYKALTEDTAMEYVKKNLDIFSEEAVLRCKEIGDGNLNLVFRVWEEISSKSIILKQALPYARIVGEAMPVTLDRARIESEALMLQGELCPALTPKVYRFDRDLYLTVMEDLSDHIILRKGLIEGKEYPNFAENIGEFMAYTLFFTSDLGMDQVRKKQLQKKFINPELCKITEDLVFSEPYFDAAGNKIEPHLLDRVEENWKNKDLIKEVAILKEGFMTKAQALIHGDLHTGSIFVTEKSTKVIDPEFAFYGPMGFDIGAIIGNFILNYAAQPAYMEKDQQKLQHYRSYLLESIRKIWQEFYKEFIELWEIHVKAPIESSNLYKEVYMRNLFEDTLGYAGCKMIRRIYGLAGVADIDNIKELVKRSRAQMLALDIGEMLILKRREIKDIDEVIEKIKSFD